MGQILGYKHGENSVDNVDPRLWDIVQNAVSAVPYDAVIRSGSERGKGDKGNHSGGYAVDVTLYDPSTGQVIPDTGRKGGAAAAKVYEQYAQAARVYQQQKYPELGNSFRWGGGFRQGYPFDLMHLDITPNAKGAMAYYDWDTGFNKVAFAAMPELRGMVTGGLGGPEGRRLVAQYEQSLKGGPVPPGSIPSPTPADMSPRLAFARTNPDDSPFAPETWTSPRVNDVGQGATLGDLAAFSGRPAIPSQFDSPRTAQQVADLYAGILPAPSAPGTTIAGRPDAPISDNTFNTRTGPAPVPSPFRDSVLARVNATRAELAAPPRAPLPSMVTGRPDAPIPSNRLPARTTVAGRPDAPISDNTFNATPRPPLPMPRSAANDARARAGLWTGGDPGMGGLLGIPMASSIPPQGAAPPAREQSPLRDSSPTPATMSADLARLRSPATISAPPPVPATRTLVASNEPQFIPRQVRVPNPAYVAPSGMTFTPTGGTVTVDQRNAIAGVPANSYQQPIRPQVPQYMTRTVMVPNPAYRAAPVPAPLPSFRRAPVPATMSPALAYARANAEAQQRAQQAAGVRTYNSGDNFGSHSYGGGFDGMGGNGSLVE